MRELIVRKIWEMIDDGNVCRQEEIDWHNVHSRKSDEPLFTTTPEEYPDFPSLTDQEIFEIFLKKYRSACQPMGQMNGEI